MDVLLILTVLLLNSVGRGGGRRKGEKEEGKERKGGREKEGRGMEEGRDISQYMYSLGAFAL